MRESFALPPPVTFLINSVPGIRSCDKEMLRRYHRYDKHFCKRVTTRDSKVANKRLSITVCWTTTSFSMST